MKYLVSNYGAGIAVGLLQEEGATEDINLSHNLFDCHADYNTFHGLINFSSLQKFKRFLIYKEYFKYCSENRGVGKKDFLCLLRSARRARNNFRENVSFHNFMSQISASNSFYSIGTHQKEVNPFD